MTKKSFFFDIDGTLLDDAKQLPQSTKLAISKLQEQNHHIAIATGRAPFIFKKLREKLNINSYIALNGQYIVWENELIFQSTLNREALDSFVKKAGENKDPLTFVTGDYWYSNMKDHKYISQVYQNLKISEKIAYKPNIYQEADIIQVMLFSTDYSAYEAEFKDYFDFVRFSPYGVDLIAKGRSKAEGVKILLEKMKTNLDDAYAFGDGLNDIEMLKYVPNSFAMGNGLEEVKVSAKYVTKAVDKDGIFLSLKKHNLIK